MKEIIINEDNLKDKDINKTTLKARAVIINDQEEISIAYYAGLYLLPGGKVHEDERPLTCLKREVKEETGIKLKITDQEPELIVKHYIKDYPVRDKEQEVYNRLIETYYYFTNDNQDIDNKQLNLTESEISKGFSIKRVKLKDVNKLLASNNSNNSRNKYFTNELLTVLKELKQTAKLIK